MHKMRSTWNRFLLPQQQTIQTFRQWIEATQFEHIHKNQEQKKKVLFRFLHVICVTCHVIWHAFSVWTCTRQWKKYTWIENRVVPYKPPKAMRINREMLVPAFFSLHFQLKCWIEWTGPTWQAVAQFLPLQVLTQCPGMMAAKFWPEHSKFSILPLNGMAVVELSPPPYEQASTLVNYCGFFFYSNGLSPSLINAVTVVYGIAQTGIYQTLNPNMSAYHFGFDNGEIVCLSIQFIFGVSILEIHNETSAIHLDFIQSVLLLSAG